jgi:hypothetical protein
MAGDPCIDIERAVSQVLALKDATLSSVPFDLFLGNQPPGTKPNDYRAFKSPKVRDRFESDIKYNEWKWQFRTSKTSDVACIRRGNVMQDASKNLSDTVLVTVMSADRRLGAAIFWRKLNLVEYWDSRPIADDRYRHVETVLGNVYKHDEPPPIANSSCPRDAFEGRRPEEAECRMWCLYWAVLRICLECRPGSINDWFLSKTQKQQWNVIDAFRKLLEAVPKGEKFDPTALLRIPDMAPCREEVNLRKRLANPDVELRQVPQDKRLKLTYDHWKNTDHGSAGACLIVHKGAIKFLHSLANMRAEPKFDVAVRKTNEEADAEQIEEDNAFQWTDAPNPIDEITHAEWSSMTRYLFASFIESNVDRYRVIDGSVFEQEWSATKPTVISIETASHALGAIYWPRDNVLEMWNTVPLGDTTFWILARLIKQKLNLSSYPTAVDGGATFDMQYPRDWVDAEKPDDVDAMCQTWVWYWAIMRIAFGCPSAKLKKWIEATAVAERADLMKRFFAILASVGNYGGRGVPNLDELSKYMDLSMCQTKKPRSSNGYYAPPNQ